MTTSRTAKLDSSKAGPNCSASDFDRVGFRSLGMTTSIELNISAGTMSSGSKRVLHCAHGAEELRSRLAMRSVSTVDLGSA